MFSKITSALLLWLLFALSWGVAGDSPGFRKARAGYAFVFPRDHGSHPDFELEWWYLTGHLEDRKSGRAFGFLATFFRSALKPSPDSDASSPASSSTATPFFGKDQAFLAHVALLDVKDGRFHFEERLNRGGWDADAATTDLDLRNGNWSLKRQPTPENTEMFQLNATILADAQFSLTLAAAKPRVIFGENGISRKSLTGEAASHYITFPRLATSGQLRYLGTQYEVTGTAWMDHEFSSSQLGPEQTGWDWASIQFDDQREIMLYRLRDQEGRADPASRLTWIDHQSRQSSYPPDAWSWEAQRTWHSAETGATYPIDFIVTAPDPADGVTRRFRLRPLAEKQEITGKLDGIAYWEGACEVLDESGKRIGNAYVELTGYDGRLNERLR